MRFKISFQLSQTPQLLPLNYKYPLSSWIYKVLSSSDKEFTALLHENGYRLENGKQFKFFTFSDFSVPRGKWKIISDRMKIWAEEISLTVSFLLPEQVQNFVAGLFQEQEAVIGDKTSQLKLKVKTIEALPVTVPVQDSYLLKSQSPIFLQKKVEGRAHNLHISPTDPDFNRLFSRNLIDKYKAHCLNSGLVPLKLEEKDVVLKSLDTQPRSMKQIIKAFKKEETHLRAFKFNFELKAPRELIEIGLNAGFGAENAQGFGCCELDLTVHETSASI